MLGQVIRCHAHVINCVSWICYNVAIVTLVNKYLLWHIAHRNYVFISIIVGYQWFYYQHFTQLIILSLYTISMLTLDLLILSCNGFHLIWLIVHTTSHYLIIVLIFSCTLRVQFLALCFSQCIFSLCLKLLTLTLSYTIHLLMTYNYRCLFPQIEYLSYFTLCSHV